MAMRMCGLPQALGSRQVSDGRTRPHAAQWRRHPAGGALGAAGPSSQPYRQDIRRGQGSQRRIVRLRAGEVHGLLGKNGSGKSTLVKILAGFHACDPAGSMEFNGEAVALPLKPGDFRRLGMSFVHQNLGLVSSLTVLENLRISSLTSLAHSFINWPNERRQAREALARFDLRLDTEERIDRLSAVDRALLAIVRAFEEIRVASERTGRPVWSCSTSRRPSCPARASRNSLASSVRSPRTARASCSSRTTSTRCMTITDRATVLRDGSVAGSLVTAQATHEDVVEMIVGRKLARSAPVRSAEKVDAQAAREDRERLHDKASQLFADRRKGRDSRPHRPDRIRLRGTAVPRLRRPATEQRHHCLRRRKGRGHVQPRPAQGDRSRSRPPSRRPAGRQRCRQPLHRRQHVLPDIDRFF